MVNIQYSSEALSDLEDIRNHITVELASPMAAESMICLIFKRIGGLRSFPEMGARLSAVVGLSTDYRYLVCKNFLVIYRISSASVFVVRVLYARRNYLKILFGD